MKLLFLIIPIIAVAAVALLFVLSSNELNAYILKVGKADASILHSKDGTVVIDCGESDDGEKVLKKLGELKIGTIDKLILTHFDKDHIGGAAQVLSSISVREVILPSYTPENPESDEYLALVAALESVKGDTEIRYLTDDWTFSLGKTAYHIYTAGEKVYKDSPDNNCSLVTQITNGSDILLFAGDIERDRIADILEKGIGRCAFLKVPHHGRIEENTEAFFKAVYPDYAVICCSEKNPPDEEVLSILESLSVRTYLTDTADVKVTSTAHGVTVGLE